MHSTWQGWVCPFAERIGWADPSLCTIPCGVHGASRSKPWQSPWGGHLLPGLCGQRVPEGSSSPGSCTPGVGGDPEGLHLPLIPAPSPEIPRFAPVLCVPVWAALGTAITRPGGVGGPGALSILSSTGAGSSSTGEGSGTTKQLCIRSWSPSSSPCHLSQLCPVTGCLLRQVDLPKLLQ